MIGRFMETLSKTLFIDFPHQFNHEDVCMRQHNRHPMKAMALMTAISSQIVGSILIGIFAGKWLDRYFDAEPLFLIIGLLLGLAAGIFAMLRTVRQYSEGD